MEVWTDIMQVYGLDITERDISPMKLTHLYLGLVKSVVRTMTQVRFKQRTIVNTQDYREYFQLSPEATIIRTYDTDLWKEYRKEALEDEGDRWNQEVIAHNSQVMGRFRN